jgi:uncharacterized protein involved in cysteine biosynthesis
VKPGFWTGAGTLPRAAKQLASSPPLWRYAIVPVVVLLSLIIVGITLLTWFGIPQVFHAVVAADSRAWYERLGGVALAAVAWLVGSVLVLLSSWIITPVACAPALEHLVRQVETTLGAPAHPPLPFWVSLWCGLRAQLTGLLALGPIWLVLWVLNLAAPFLSPVLVPARLFAVALSLAWNLLDYPLTLRGVRMRQRLRFIRTHIAAVFGFGLAFAILFWIPLAAVLLLPLGVMAATRLVWELANNDGRLRAELCPQLSSKSPVRSPVVPPTM